MEGFHTKSNAGTRRQPGVQKRAPHVRERRLLRALWRVTRLTFWVGLVWLAVVELAALCLLLGGGELVSGVEFFTSVTGVVAGLTWLRGLPMAIAGVGPWRVWDSRSRDDEAWRHSSSGIETLQAPNDGDGWGHDSDEHSSPNIIPSVNPASGLSMLDEVPTGAAY